MTGMYVVSALFLLANLAAGLVRIVIGPAEVDRMLAAQLFGTTGVAILLLLARVTSPSLVDVALVFALLTVVASVAFVRRVRQAILAAGGDT